MERISADAFHFRWKNPVAFEPATPSDLAEHLPVLGVRAPTRVARQRFSLESLAGFAC